MCQILHGLAYRHYLIINELIGLMLQIAAAYMHFKTQASPNEQIHT